MVVGAVFDVEKQFHPIKQWSLGRHQPHMDVTIIVEVEMIFKNRNERLCLFHFVPPSSPPPHFSVSCLCSFESYVHPLVLCKPCIICWFNWQIWSASIFASPLAAICLKQDPFRFKFCPKIWWTIPSLFGPFVKDWGQFLGTVCAQYLQIICTVFGRPLLRWTCTFIRKCLIWKGKEGGSS